jgi:DNA polymerase-3 subunit delta'
MLKTLEEPQGRSLIILLTDQPHSLLPTILSRCQLARFAALPDELVMRQLASRGVDAQTAGLAAKIAEGSLGLAVRWSEDGVVAAAGQLRARVDAMLTGRAVDDLPAWMAAAGADYAQKQEDRDGIISKDQANREAVVLYMRLAADHLRGRLAQTDDALLQLRMCRMIDDLAQAQMYVEGNVNVNLVLEHIANRLA